LNYKLNRIEGVINEELSQSSISYLNTSSLNSFHNTTYQDILLILLTTPLRPLLDLKSRSSSLTDFSFL
ncbi:9892_t:CDS:1, partial [Funneliformis caledonium]